MKFFYLHIQVTMDVPQVVFRDVLFIEFFCSFPSDLCDICVCLKFVDAREAEISCDHLVTDTT